MASLDAAAAARLLDALTAIGAQAALAVRAAGGTSAVRIKADGSPVTATDETAETVIHDGLLRLAPELPIVSEEQAERPIVDRTSSYFLVDPLDGTRDFIAGRDEYTINIALVTAAAPLLGIIVAPALGLIWRGLVGRGAERMTLAGDGTWSAPGAIRVRPRPQGGPVVLVSRSHLEGRTQAYVDRLPQAQIERCGSALKFCRVAEGSADLYPRLAPTRDWDVGAGHAIVAAAGGQVAAPDGVPLVYGSAGLVIPGFIAGSGA